MGITIRTHMVAIRTLTPGTRTLMAAIRIATVIPMLTAIIRTVITTTVNWLRPKATFTSAFCGLN